MQIRDEVEALKTRDCSQSTTLFRICNKCKVSHNLRLSHTMVTMTIMVK